MSSHDDFIKRFERFEESNESLPETDAKWVNDFMSAMAATGELSLKKDLEKLHEQHVRKVKIRQLSIISGIAASLIIAGSFLLSTNTSAPIQLQYDDAPVYSDSASYDSTKQKINKNHLEDVDK